MKTLLCFLISFTFLVNSSVATEISISKFNLSITKTGISSQEMFGYLRVHRQGKGVSVNWGMTSMSDIAYFIVERSYDGEYFDHIQQVSMNGLTRKLWKDESISPGYIYNRNIYMMYVGTKIYTETDTIRIVQCG